MDEAGFEEAVAKGQYRIGDIVWPSSVAFAESIGHADHVNVSPAVHLFQFQTNQTNHY
jgi:hypothetical protein